MSVSHEDSAYAAARRTEQIRPVSFDLAVGQYIETKPVAVLAEAGLEVIDCDHGVMNRTGHADNVSLTPRTADRPNRRYRSQATFVFQP